LELLLRQMAKFFAVATLASCSSADWAGQIRWGGRCLDVKDGKPTNGELQLWDCHAKDHPDYQNQVFSNNGYTISVLDPAYSITGRNGVSDGAIAIMGRYQCQPWNGDVGCFTSGDVNPISITDGNMCLDVKDGHNYNGAVLQLWTCHAENHPDHQNQKFNRDGFSISADKTSSIDLSTRSPMFNWTGQINWGVGGKDNCVDVKDGKFPNGELQLWTCHDKGHPDYQNQEFRWDGYTIHATMNPDFSITGRNGVSRKETAVMGRCEPWNGDDHCFAPVPDSTGTVITIRTGNMCLDVTDGKNDEGTVLQLWECHREFKQDSPNQQFYNTWRDYVI